MINPIDILLLLFVFFALCQFFYCCFFWIRLAIYKTKALQDIEPKAVSIIIAARNEAENLKKNLPSFLKQNYNDFEVIVANDCSWDGSIDVLMDFEKEFPNLKILDIKEQEKYPTGKKFALFLAIKAAKHENLLFSDADCQPLSENWINEMQGKFQAKKEIVLGYGTYEKQNSLLNLFIQFDTLMTALNYFSFHLAGLTYMGVGRNLAYQKVLFFAQKGFLKNIKHPSGDDDLFVNAAATKENVAMNIHPESFTISKPKTKWSDWFRQKKRHLSTGKFYKFKHKFWLGFGSFSFLILLVLGIYFSWKFIQNPSFSVLLNENLPTENSIFYVKFFFGFLGFVFLFRWIIMTIACGKLKEKRLIYFLPFLDLFYFLMQMVWSFPTKKNKRNSWK